MADLEELAGRLDHELPDVAWDEPERIRLRGRTRAQRRTTVLAAVSLLVVAAGAGWLVTGTRSTPARPAPATTSAATPVPATTPATPSPTDQTPVVDGSTLFPKSALLQGPDVGAGYELTNDVGYSPGAYPTWVFGSSDCPAYPQLGITAHQEYLWFRHANLEGGGPPVFTEGSRYPAGLAADVMADIDSVTKACASWETPGGEATSEQRPGTTTTTYTVLAKDFAGDQSRLVRQRVRTVGDDGAELYAGVTTIAAVRVGDRVSFVMLELDDPQRVRLLGERAADRLCTADDSC
ncbi:hypothetical protein SAMN05421812_118118 [Asanoa hainanensis]|uniref:Uncharacterized protein n=1 Tax=Asanoa hainanensis TaxID=560556 RepID=A0A239PCS4_9ACTN|nr:hypothetical protein [Asanoa hainanensis]SNT64861.1 hypothetical protein SAMN05421812_118118 [Asanoa hainanensis]